jgi:preprotein translocase subunit Sec61beta
MAACQMLSVLREGKSERARTVRSAGMVRYVEVTDLKR